MIRYARGRETDNLKLTTVALSQSLSKSEWKINAGHLQPP
jgi:hypothetical protein